MAYTRKTRDEFTIQGLYQSDRWRWEDVTTEATRKEGRQRLKEYRENEPGTSFRMIRQRVLIEVTA